MSHCRAQAWGRGVALGLATIVLATGGCFRTHSVVDGSTDGVHDAEAPDGGQDAQEDGDDDGLADAMTDVEPETVGCDEDGDGWESVACGGSDCDDRDPAVHPGAMDVCLDGLDQDCDSVDATAGLRAGVLTLVDRVHTGVPIRTVLIWTGGEYVLYWSVTGDEGIHVVRADPALAGTSGDVRVRDHEDSFDVAWDGDGYGCVWTTEDAAGTSLVFQRLDAGCEPATAESALTERTDLVADASGYHGPRILAVPEGYVVLFETSVGDEAVLNVTRVDRDGVQLWPESPLSGDPRPMGLFAAAWTGSVIAAVWQSTTSGTFPLLEGVVQMGRVSGDGELIGEVVDLRDVVNAPNCGSVMWTSSRYGVFWDGGAPLWEPRTYRLTIVDEDGGLVDETTVDWFDGSTHSSGMDGVWADGAFGLAWGSGDATSGTVEIAQATADGEVDLSPTEIGTASPPGNVKVTWTGSEFGLSWSDLSGDDGEQRMRVHLARVGFCP